MPPKPTAKSNSTDTTPKKRSTEKKSSPPNLRLKYTPSYLYSRTRGRQQALQNILPDQPDIDNHLENPTAMKHTPVLPNHKGTPKLNTQNQKKSDDPEALRRRKEAEAINKQLGTGIGRMTSKSMEDLLSSQADSSIPSDPSSAAFSKSVPSKDDLTSDLIKEIQFLKSRIQELTLKANAPPRIKILQPQGRNLNPQPRNISRRPSSEHQQEPADDSDASNSDDGHVSNSSRSNHQRRNPNFRCEMGQWPIKFKGTGVQKFLKKLNRLQKSYDYDDATVAKYFHLLVEGRAADWYWIYCEEYEDVELKHLKIELAKAFRSEETDMTLITRMYERKQGRDSFSKFYDDVLDINFSMKSPLDDSQIIEILRTNMDDEVRQRIFTYETKDRTKFYHKANSAYLDACKVKEKRGQFNTYPKVQRRVNEIDFEELSAGEVEEISTKLNSWKQKRTLKCYNCHGEDHLLRKCPVPITRFFCFVCGLEGVAYPQCPDCLNRKRSAEEVRNTHS